MVNNTSRNATIGLGLCLALTALACCCGLFVVGLSGLLLFPMGSERGGSSATFEFAPDPTLEALGTELAGTFTAEARTPIPSRTPTPTPRAGTPGTPAPAATPAPLTSSDTLSALLAADIQPRDLRAIAEELTGNPNIPITTGAAPADHPIGTVLEFTASNNDTNTTFTVRARLVYKTENAYFFAEEGVPVNERDVRRLLDDFQAKTYPTTREFFGSEWNPGVDGDPRLYILYVRGLGFGTLGYYSSEDQYTRAANPESNEKEMFYINADVTEPGDDLIASTLAHEFQHMIHWYQDRNEETWLNEGASMLAEILNGYDPSGYAEDFVANPDLQLTTWTDGDTLPHYGAAMLFLAYFLDRFGEEATQALLAEPLNGMRAVDAVLAARGLTDPATGAPLTAADVFADWVIANYLNDARAADGRFVYSRLPNPPRPQANDIFYACPVATQTATVSQFGADYYEFRCDGTLTLNFAGARTVPVVKAQAHSGRYAVWSHRNDESVTTLTRAFDFGGLSSVTLSYWVWYDLEAEYDYAYLKVSEDGGRTWAIVRAPGTTDRNPNGTGLGWGYTGDSGGWVEESVDLSQYAGQEVLVRFSYVTDAALNMPGLLLDDVSVPQLNYFEDFENGADGWQAQGFTRMDNVLPQSFSVQVIRQRGREITVERLPLDEANRGSLTLDVQRGERVTLVVSGTTPFTTEAAAYQFGIDR